ncbi:MAG: enoyl-CoA hydratase/isomerase family protein [Flavobacteriaceae bacterium]|jgi:enoyl-CoA hydratase|nr:enoyl-CoA hydratase/isomerase family protein [Flavobacteriaceae bacterium]NVJ72267.1 enoyl-CoA hydratase/isomerase family protein [Flavobacteriaceae bacterium]
MTYRNIKIAVDQKTAVVVINRPKKLNALNRETIAELGSAIDELSHNSSIRVIVITGEGDKAFVAGADIAEFAHFSSEEGQELAQRGQEELFDKIEMCPKIVIAAINGYALGGGLELAMASHIRIASENALMGLPEVSLGVIPGYGGTQRLPKLIGKGRAMELISAASMIDAKKACDWGLVNSVVPQDELMDTAIKLATKISKNSASAISNAIDAINAYDQDGGFQREIENFGHCFGTDDFKEGTDAFLNKRKPNFD